MQLNISMTRLEMFEKHWPKIALAMSQDVLGASHSKRELWEEITSGRSVFWYTDNSFIITCTIEYPKWKSLHVWLAGGSGKEIWGKMFPILAEYGKANKYSAITGCGRASWARMIKKYGAEVAHTTFVRRL